jgi:8-oxo-dGTP diphosphatase
MIDKINIRIYACCIKNEKILALYEEYVGESLLKLPGGGLEFGESVIDCLRREMDEELNVKIKNIQHFYTQEDFIPSRFRDNEQLLTIYYTVDLEDENDLIIRDPCIEKVEWIPLKQENPFTLPIDAVVFEKLKLVLGI